MVKKYGTRDEVWEGSAQMTTGKITKEMLMMSPKNKIVSIKQYEQAKKNYPKMVDTLCKNRSSEIAKSGKLQNCKCISDIQKVKLSVPYSNIGAKYGDQFKKMEDINAEWRRLTDKLKRTPRTHAKYKSIVERIEKLEAMS